MSSVKESLLRKALINAPLAGINTVIGGNAVDKLRRMKDPKVQRIIRRVVDNRKGSVNHKILKTTLRYSGNKRAMYAYGSERLKTHAARAALGTGIAAVAIKNHREKQNRLNQAASMLSSSASHPMYDYNGGYQTRF